MSPNVNLSRARRAVHHQREEVRRELHDTVDRMVDGWPNVQHWAAVAEPTKGETGRRGNGVVDPTAAVVEALEANRAHRWLRMFEQWRWDARRLDGLLCEIAASARPAPPSAADDPEAEPCARCGLAMGQRMHRLDGAPYCAKAVDSHGIRGQACYFLVWRERRNVG